tara:strand:- start:123 stop:395 length:273 start_codon:yes stop_codon:yes gene_type:complete
MAIGFTRDGNEQEQIDQTLEDNLNRVKQNATVNNNTSIYCLECGEVIPKARRLAVKNANYCLTCQSDLDKLNSNTISLYNRKANYHTQLR